MDGQSLINVNGNNVPTLELLLMLTLISLLPFLVIMMTSFTRIVIVLSFTRTAIGVQQSPPNMVITGLALFLTLFIMRPVFTEINTTAYQPYLEKRLEAEEALQRAAVPLKEFMLRNTTTETLDAFIDMSGVTVGEEDTATDLPLTVIVPSFMTSELKRAFMAGFRLYIPFLLIDIIVSSSLMSMGMMMLPPATISMPFKLLLFVMVDGWELLFSSLVQSYH